MTHSVLALVHGVTTGHETAHLGTLGPAFERRGLGVRIASFTAAEHPPRLDHGIRMLVVMGSLDSVLDRDVPWLDRESRYIAEAVGRGVPVLGVCFGAQLLSRILGGRVVRAERPETGLVPVESIDTEQIPGGRWYSFHHDQIIAPCDAQVLATSAECVQAFRHGPHLGVQFHPEVTPRTLDSWRDGFVGRAGGPGEEAGRLLVEHSREVTAEAPALARQAEQLVRGFVRHARLAAAA
ncbi:type 1 glutamine amidotransferase [Raineyella sp. LH-20]|uniref:type 1 glutamine amidotransferase n=1 Tax=Raineyella sp. LH-20 TaxID=3081204 RepID=UPI002953964B|nr:gamma-glutamyl-gamma-aminobutyrate hydrolase family protein [Raineyella sp. LH-20]WOP18110.1 gamma-glutamyl-gamma-aminobutyrate hydrolase family protein [Raineyella sp. LH-20]